MTEINPEKIIAKFNKIDTSLAKIRKLIAPIVFAAQPAATTAAPPRGPSSNARSPQDPEIPVLDIDVSGIQFFQKKNSEGQSEKAGPRASWGWCFGFDQDGEYHPESKDLVQAIQQYGRVQVGNRIYELRGRDGKLLNFKKQKEE